MKIILKKSFNPTIIKYFFSYILILTVLIFGFFFIIRNQLTSRYFDQLINQTETQLDSFTSQLSDDLTYLYQIDSSLSSNIKLILSRYKNESYYDYETSNELKKYGDVISLIDSIIYKRKDSNEIISTNQPVTYSDGLFDIIKVKNDQTYFLSFDVNTYSASSKDQIIFLSDNKSGYLIYYPRSNKNRSYTLFYILNTGEMKREVSHFITDNTPAIAMISPDKQTVFGINDELLAPYYESMTLEKGIYKLDQSTSLCVLPGITNDFFLVSLISNDALFHQINISFASSYVALMVLAIIGFFLVTIAMQITYKPLHNLTQKIVPEMTSGNNYIEQLDIAFSEFSEMNQLLQNKLDKYRLTMQKTLLDSVITSNSANVNKNLLNIDQFFDPNSYNEIFILRMKNPNGTFPWKKILDYLVEVLPGNDSCFILENSADTAAFLLNYTGFEQNKRAILLNLCTNFYEESQYVSILSKSSSSALDIPSLYENTKLACEHWAQTPVIDCSELSTETNTVSYVYPHDKLNEFSENLNSFNMQTARQTLTELYQLLDSSITEPDIFPDFFIKCVLIDILSIIIGSINQSSIGFKLYKELYFETLFYCRSCAYAEKKEQIKKNTSLLLDFYEQEISKKIINAAQLRKIIDEAFCQPDFTISTLADHFHISIAYMSYLTKKELNMNFSDYLWDLRLTKAKELLENTDMLIDDICIEVGYLNTSSFRRKFKQCTGMTPSQYRTQSAE